MINNRCIQLLFYLVQWRIQDFPEGGAEGAPTLKVDVLTYFYAENCTKMKEFGPLGGVPGALLDPPMLSPTKLREGNVFTVSPTGTDIWWLLNYVGLTSGRYASYWNVFVAIWVMSETSEILPICQ